MQPIAAQASCGLNAEFIWLSLLHSVWIGLAAAGCVALVLQGRRTLSHRFRHAILLVCLSLVACGPPALAVGQLLAAWSSRDVPILSARVVVLPGPSGSPPEVLRDPPELTRPVDGSVPVRIVQSMAIVIARLGTGVRDARTLLLTAWSLVILGLAAVLALGARRVNRLRREAEAAPAAVQERARRLGRRLRLRKVPAVRLHPRLSQPCLCGVLRPAILLPDHWFAAAEGGPLDAVLAHELAHARRLDHLVNVGQRLIEALYFFHPAVHWLSMSLRRHREHCADELAVRITGDPLSLARALECLAHLRAVRSAARPIGAALGGETYSLLPRMQELIGMTPVRTRPQVWPYAALPLAALLGLVAISAGSAQDQPSPSHDVPQARQKDDSVTESTSAARTEPVPLRGTVPPDPDPDRLVSYEVRRLDFEEGGWRGYLGGRIAPIGKEGEVRGWLIDEGALLSLFKRLEQRAPKFTAVHAPRVTSFQGAHATVCFGLGKMNADEVQTAMREFSRNRDKRIPGGLFVDLVGTFSPRGTRLSVDLRDSEIPTSPGTRDGVRAVDGSAGAPAFLDRRYEGSHDIPEGSSLVVSLGRREQPVGGRSVTRERLVIIMPRRILLEKEEVAPRPPVDARTGR
ncbi:MAG: M56 family metallopeptidase [Isosphaeraceae bacterium]